MFESKHLLEGTQTCREKIEVARDLQHWFLNSSSFPHNSQTVNNE